jgi:hypothetical protein
MVAHGAIPEGQLVCHRCDNPGCVNPEHLFLGTHRANSQDMVRKDRQARGERHGTRTKPHRRARPAGEQNPAAKLDREKVEQIRARYRGGNVSMKDLAIESGVSPTTVFHVVRSFTWVEA